ncbi:MAG: ATP-binding cassette domain-containing protein [Rhodospirillaceae bacterium]|nr:ATP-binding cassette domain-containing protein [Rhodospirillaceae bacterium]
MASWLAHSAALVVVLVLLPFGLGEFTAYQLALYFLNAIAALGVGLCWGRAGFLPLGQAMFVGLGGYLSGLALIKFNGSLLLLVLLPLAALIPGLIAFGLGLLLFRGRRETGPYFALITLAMSLLAFQIANGWNSVTGGFNGLKGIPALPGLDDISDAYWISAAALAVAIIGTGWLVRAPLGTLWLAIAQNERRTAFLGFNVTRAKAVVFGLSGVLGGLAGTLYAPEQNLVTPQLVGFVLSAELVIWAAVGGRGSLYGPVLGAILIGMLTAELRDRLAYWEVLLAILFIVVVRWAPQGLSGLLAPIAARLQLPEKAAPIAAPARPAAARAATVAFDEIASSAGPVRILDGLTIAIDHPGITCLIGPNGAGKTSCFNVLTGELPANFGTIRFDDAPITGMSPTAVTRLGIARKFQIPNVFPELSVADNLHLALWGSRARPFDLLKPSLHRWTSPVIGELAERYAFLAAGKTRAGDLSHGERQILELTMALAMEPRLLLLDEPCAGLSPEETRAVIDVIEWAKTRLKLAIVIIEHDMSLVQRLADRVMVLHQGRLLAAGTVAEIQANPAVRAVYAGGSK